MIDILLGALFILVFILVYLTSLLAKLRREYNKLVADMKQYRLAHKELINKMKGLLDE